MYCNDFNEFLEMQIKVFANEEYIPEFEKSCSEIDKILEGCLKEAKEFKLIEFSSMIIALCGECYPEFRKYEAGFFAVIIIPMLTLWYKINHIEKSFFCKETFSIMEEILSRFKNLSLQKFACVASIEFQKEFEKNNNKKCEETK